MDQRASLSGVRTRLNRARKHFVDLDRASTRVVRGQPDAKGGVDVKLDSNAGECIGTAAIPVVFPDELGAMVGEVLYHLRSTLDNLAWQLVLSNGETPDKRTEFPVFVGKPEFRRSSPRMMRGMSDPVRAKIEELQPFNESPTRPEHTTVWLIHDLNRIDKHRLPHMTCLWLCHVHAVFSAPPEGGAVRGDYVAPVGPLEDGAKLFHFRWNPDLMKQMPDEKVYVEIDVSTDVAIQNPEASFIFETGKPSEGMPLRSFFNAAFDYVENVVIPLFSPDVRS